MPRTVMFPSSAETINLGEKLLRQARGKNHKSGLNAKNQNEEKRERRERGERERKIVVESFLAFEREKEREDVENCNKEKEGDGGRE